MEGSQNSAEVFAVMHVEKGLLRNQLKVFLGVIPSLTLQTLFSPGRISCARARARVCVCARACQCVCVCVRARARACQCVCMCRGGGGDEASGVVSTCD